MSSCSPSIGSAWFLRSRRRLIEFATKSPVRRTNAIATTQVAALAYALLRSVTADGLPYGVPVRVGRLLPVAGSAAPKEN